MTKRVAAVLAVLCLTGGVLAEEPPAAPVTPKTRDAAIVDALRYLDDHLFQLQSGGSPRRPYTLAVAGHAYLLARDKGDRGARKLPGRTSQLERIHDELSRYVKTVADLYARDDKKKARRKPPRATPPGMPPGFGPGRMTSQYVWPLGVAAHFFAECVARGYAKGPSLKALRSIAGVLASSQQADGGWGHDDAARPGMGLPPIKIPKPGGGQLEYPPTLLAASNCALSGLGLAHRVIRKRDDAVLERGRAYLTGAQNGDGTFPYDPKQKHGGRGASAMAGGIELARTPGAVLALLCSGAAKDDPVVSKALDAIDRSPELMSDGHGSAAMALQFGALLAHARGDRAWATFRRIFLPKILEKQEKDGAFLCVCSDAPGVTNDTRAIPGLPAGFGDSWANEGKVYVTAIHTLILLLDRAESRILPEAPAPRGTATGPSADDPPGK